jgi:hypothetical protein
VESRVKNADKKMALLIKGMNFSLTQRRKGAKAQRRKGKIFKGSIWKFHTSIQQRQKNHQASEPRIWQSWEYAKAIFNNSK